MKFLNKINVYNLMISILFLLSLVGMFIFGWKAILPQITIAVITAGLLDTLIYYYKTKRFSVSKSGIITGFFVGLVLSVNQVFYVPLFASLSAILMKHIFKYFTGFFNKNNNLFNPAAMGIFLSMLIFKVSDGWVGAGSLIAVLILGFILILKFRVFNLVAGFLISFFAIFFIINLIFGDLINFSLNFLNSPLYFFAFFMLTEPKTSPNNFKGKIIYGVISGAVISLMLFFMPAYSFILGLLICNLFVPLINKINN